MIALAAALAATAAFTAPVPVGTAVPSNQVANPLSIQSDPREGAWIQFASPLGERLVRVHEDGRTVAVELPPKLRGEGLDLTPLPSGWTLAVNRYWPGGKSQELACQPVGSGSSLSVLHSRAPKARVASEARCSELVVAQLSPGGHWTAVQSLPHSFGRESFTSEPVESGGEIELAWTEEEQFAPIRVAVARPGHSFGAAHLARSVLHREANRVLFPVIDGALYLRGEYAPNPPFGTVRFWVDRRLYGAGSLGPPHFVHGYLVREPGRSLEGANGSELWIWGEVFQPLEFARRSRWASTFERQHVIVKESDGDEQFTQSFNHRTLIALDTPVRGGRSQISTIEISPQGRLGPLRAVEPQPSGSEHELSFASAIDDAGTELIATSGGESGDQIWLHASVARCPGFHTKGLLTTTSRGPFQISAGRKGVFQVAWIDSSNQVQVSAVRVRCAATQ
jgi:hypothetical protein